MRPGTIEQLCRFFKTSLTPTQLPHPRLCLRYGSWMSYGELAGGRCQLGFRVSPGPSRDADSRIQCPAKCKQRPNAPPFTKRFEPLAPLNRAIVIVHVFAGSNHVAARCTDDGEICRLAA